MAITIVHLFPAASFSAAAAICLAVCRVSAFLSASCAAEKLTARLDAINTFRAVLKGAFINASRFRDGSVGTCKYTSAWTGRVQGTRLREEIEARSISRSVMMAMRKSRPTLAGGGWPQLGLVIS